MEIKQILALGILSEGMMDGAALADQKANQALSLRKITKGKYPKSDDAVVRFVKFQKDVKNLNMTTPGSKYWGERRSAVQAHSPFKEERKHIRNLLPKD